MYKALDIDIDLPDLLKEDIENMLNYMNENIDHISIDLYQSNLRSDINSCDDLPRDVAERLKRYYCNGEIYNGTD